MRVPICILIMLVTCFGCRESLNTKQGERQYFDSVHFLGWVSIGAVYFLGGLDV